MNNYIDTHCHLDLFKNILEERRKEDGQGIKTITVTNAPSFFTPNQELFENSSNIRVGLGLHPQIASQYKNEIELFDNLVDKTRYIGEIGLDGSSEFQESYLLQQKLLKKVLEIIQFRDSKILTIHSKHAANEVIDILSHYLEGTDHKVILHWYSGSISDLRQAISKGFYFSINHKMAASEKGRQIITYIPNHLLLTETDAPFTFTKHINNRLQSLTYTIEKIAIQKSSSISEIKNLIYNNFKALLS